MVTLPVRDKYLIADNGNILTATPGDGSGNPPLLHWEWVPQEYGGWQEVEVLASHDKRYVLVRFVAADCYLRVDVVLWMEKRFHEAVQLYPSSKPDVDSGWQQAEASGHTIFFRGPDEEGRVGYTAAFRIVNKDGSDFR